MRIQFAKTTDWYRDGGQSSWGLGVEVDHFAGYDDDDKLKPEGWQIEIQLGTWALIFYSEAGFRAIHGDSTQYYGTFSVARP